MGDMMFNLHDIAGAAASPFDLATSQQGDNESYGPLTTGTISPRTANGWCFTSIRLIIIRKTA
jgi:hypothetical protein